jgi:mannose-6-phosphate isomerase-like protein (cupin superfamily)
MPLLCFSGQGSRARLLGDLSALRHRPRWPTYRAPDRWPLYESVPSDASLVLGPNEGRKRGSYDAAMSGEEKKVLNLRSVLGLEATVTTPSATTDGAYVELDVMLEPGGHTTIHYHPEQEETYQVLEGTLEVFRDGDWHKVPAGESLTVPVGRRNSNSLPDQAIPKLGLKASAPPQSKSHACHSPPDNVHETGVSPLDTLDPPSWPRRRSRSSNSKNDLLRAPIRGSCALQGACAMTAEAETQGSPRPSGLLPVRDVHEVFAVGHVYEEDDLMIRALLHGLG